MRWHSLKWILAFVILVLFGGSLYTLHTMNRIEFERFELDDFAFDLDGVTLEGTMYVNNPTWVELEWDETPYKVYLNGEYVADGILVARQLESHTVNAFPVEQYIPWDVSLSMLQGMVKEDEIIFTINGTHEVGVFGLSVDNAFHVEMDVKPQIEYYLRQQMDQITARIPFEVFG